ncbi:RloB family protein [Neolewinella aurantiaca]|uniref:RloB family protein n=1 Tax=Neolewinella aurantiaca TaxID=2602767 RepID=UPI00164F8BA9|nr:RloB family protein [Neolewinella aurantiaca]
MKSRQRSRVAVVVRSKRTFLILCEGQTEADYFLAFSNERIAVTAHDLGCAGKSLVDCALQYRDDGSFDEVWCVYDLDYSRGNVKAQANKQVSLISYNIFNLPRQITKSGQVFEVIYDGAGRKLAQIDLQGNRKDYLAGLELNNGSFESLYHPQGRAAYSNGSWSYQYVLQDHLGNTRAVFKNAVGGGVIIQ